MSSLRKLCAAFRTARVSFYTKITSNSAQAFGAGFSRCFGTSPYPPTSDPPKVDEPSKTDDPAKTSDPAKADDPAKTDDSAKAEEPAKEDDSSIAGGRPRRPRKPQVRVKFHIELHDGTRHEIEDVAGWYLCRVLTNFPNVIGKGFGVCYMKGDCSTCHVKFTKEVFETLEEMKPLEELTLPQAQEYDENSSRLSCCVKLSAAMEGTTIYLPKKRRDIRELFS